MTCATARLGTTSTRTIKIYPSLHLSCKGIAFRDAKNSSSVASATSSLVDTRKQKRFVTENPSRVSNPLAGSPFSCSLSQSAPATSAVHIPLQSGIYPSAILSAAAAVFVIAIASWFVFEEATSSHVNTGTQYPLIDTMAPEIAPGHLGNLTTEQEDKLRKLWGAVFKVCGVAGHDGADATSVNDTKSTAEPETPKKKRGFSFFRSASQPDSPSSNGNATDSTDDDKYGLTKQYQDILASQKPEEIRETMWAMMKHDHPDALLLRFLRARKWDVEKALVMLISAMNWRHTKMKVDPDIMKNGEAGAAADEKSSDEKVKKLGHDFLKQSRLGKSFLHGIDKDGRPICIVRVRLHKASDQSPESLERYTVFIIETARLALKPPVDTANIIFDMSGFTLANMDYHPVKFMIQCFEANYPESLGVVLVHNAPWVFQGIWRIIRGWLDPVVAAKVHFTNYRAGLEDFISADHLIKDLEGDEDWTYEFKEPIEGENDLMKDTQTRDQLLKEREVLYAQYEATTRRWISHPDGAESQSIKAQREEIAVRLRDGYWRLDPYVRARSLYDRQGVIRPGGDVNWYRYKDAGPNAASSGNGNSQR